MTLTTKCYLVSLYISLSPTSEVCYSFQIVHISAPPVCRKLWVRYLKLQGHRSEVSHPARRLRWRYWAQAPPCWSGMEVLSWRAVWIRRPLWAWPACRMTLVCTVKLPAVYHITLLSSHLPVIFVSCVSHLHAVCHIICHACMLFLITFLLHVIFSQWVNIQLVRTCRFSSYWQVVFNVWFNRYLSVYRFFCMYFCVWDHTDYTGNIMILYQILHACKCDMLFLWSVKLFLGGLEVLMHSHCCS